MSNFIKVSTSKSRSYFRSNLFKKAFSLNHLITNAERALVEVRQDFFTSGLQDGEQLAKICVLRLKVDEGKAMFEEVFNTKHTAAKFKLTWFESSNENCIADHTMQTGRTKYIDRVEYDGSPTVSIKLTEYLVMSPVLVKKIDKLISEA
jgi:hypothetical protein